MTDGGKKLRVGVFSFTSDEGCIITFIEILNYKYRDWLPHLDFINARALKSDNRMEPMDVAFVEGAIANERERERIKLIRDLSKKVVAVGSCAINGTPSNHRNFFDEERLAEINSVVTRFHHLPKVVPLKEFIQVDAEVPGCPMIEGKFVEVMDSYLKEFGVMS
ncbi:F420-non-reducing hydrogenase subunit G [uncultured archaeon]|nr:F420-non-reducing hydrogenase subunit G [uncultured archaeon]